MAATLHTNERRTLADIAAAIVADVNDSIRNTGSSTGITSIARSGRIPDSFAAYIIERLCAIGVPREWIVEKQRVTSSCSNHSKERDIIIIPGGPTGPHNNLDDDAIITIELKSQLSNSAKNHINLQEALAGSIGFERAAHPERIIGLFEIVFVREPSRSDADNSHAVWDDGPADLGRALQRRHTLSVRGDRRDAFDQSRPDAYGMLVIEPGPRGGTPHVHRSVDDLLDNDLIDIDDLIEWQIVDDNGLPAVDTFDVDTQIIALLDAHLAAGHPSVIRPRDARLNADTDTAFVHAHIRHCIANNIDWIDSHKLGYELWQRSIERGANNSLRYEITYAQHILRDAAHTCRHADDHGRYRVHAEAVCGTSCTERYAHTKPTVRRHTSRCCFLEVTVEGACPNCEDPHPPTFDTTTTN